jgi:hypothetical protein
MLERRLPTQRELLDEQIAFLEGKVEEAQRGIDATRECLTKLYAHRNALDLRYADEVQGKVRFLDQNVRRPEYRGGPPQVEVVAAPRIDYEMTDSSNLPTVDEMQDSGLVAASSKDRTFWWVHYHYQTADRWVPRALVFEINSLGMFVSRVASSDAWELHSEVEARAANVALVNASVTLVNQPSPSTPIGTAR